MTPLVSNQKASAQRIPPSEILLVKFGKNKLPEGKTPTFTEEDADNIIAKFKEADRELLMDFDHWSLSGYFAASAGSVSELKKTKKGPVAAKIKWSKKAKKRIASGECFYADPVLLFGIPRNRPFYIHSIGLMSVSDR